MKKRMAIVHNLMVWREGATGGAVMHDDVLNDHSMPPDTLPEGLVTLYFCLGMYFVPLVGVFFMFSISHLTFGNGGFAPCTGQKRSNPL